ncbi:MAG: PhoH family protein [Thermoprotei archaeon]|nr:MAG: PhoH family protein [Thermoprotei archaeon]
MGSVSEKLLGRIEPKTEGQRRLLDALLSDRIKIVGVFGPTGTGKSLLSSAYGVDAVSKGRYERFIITRPVVDITTGRELTSIELGDLYYKIASEYLFDLLSAAVPREELSKMIEDGRIIVADPHFLRGRTFDNSVIFFDDAQSASPENVGEVIMRIGEGSKLIVAGDPIFQKDPRVRLDGATLVREVLLGEEEAAVIDLGLKDIVRPGAKRGIRLALEFRMRKRELSETESKILESARIHAPDADVVTVVEFAERKEEFGITGKAVPDALVVVKEGYMGRLVGRGGERIRAIEQDTELRIRAIELTLDLKGLVTSVHPVSWIGRHIVDVDFAGPEIVVTVRKGSLGAFLGQRGNYVRFLDSIMRDLMGIGVRVFGG